MTTATLTTTLKTITSDDDVLNIKPGDIIRQFSNGTVSTYTVDTVPYRGRCSSDRSKCYRNAYAGVCCFTPWDPASTSRVSFSIHSDPYQHGEGYPTHDAAGHRISGYEITQS